MMYDPPCHHCQERYLGCHAECQRYAKYHAWREAKLAEKAKRRQVMDDLAYIWQDNMRKKRGHL